jgi:hypothetical protein
MIVRRLVLVGLASLCVLAGTLVFGGVAAWAAGPPTVNGESFSNVGSTTATVSAQVGAEGSPTTYRVEYGTNKVGESSTPEASVGAPEGPVGVSVELNGLQPGVEYYFRFVATNALKETAQGGEVAFTTTSLGGASASILPDERAYELVSPPSFSGEVYSNSRPGERESDFATERLSFQAAVDGEAVAYVADPPASGGNGLRGKGTGNQWLTRRTVNGWEASDIIPAGEGESATEATETQYVGFSSDLSVGIFTATSQSLALAAQPQGPANCTKEQNRVLYSHTGGGGGTLSALFTSTVTPGLCGSPLFAGTSADGSQVFFQDEARLTAEAPEVAGSNPSGREGCHVNCDLYESVGRQLSLVNVLPDGEPAGGATFGSPPLLTPEGRHQSPGLGNVISADGSRVFWTDTQAGLDMEHIYVRENGTSTLAVSQGAARYWTATPNGRYAFYTEGEKLWRFDTEHGTREELVREGLKGESAGVQGVIGTSDDGSYVYLVAAGGLAPQVEKLTCKTAEESRREAEEKAPLTPEEEEHFVKEGNEEKDGQLSVGRGCNLYFLHVGEAPKLVAVLASIDDKNTEQEYFSSGFIAGDWQPALGARNAEVAPDGRSVVFDSTQHLTGYDSHTLLSNNEGNVFDRNRREVFVYGAGTERVSCVSCSPTGAPPVSEAGSGATEKAIIETEGAGSYLPIHPSLFDGGETSMPRWISADGSRVFYVASQPLVPQDTNGLQDVYEWEREGTASCPVQVPARRDGGCLFLLSGGEDSDFSFFIDASVSGDDVFFSTRTQLVEQDRNNKTDVYDARVGGGFHEFPVACTGTGCQGVPSAPPIFATPSSVTFSGVGNFEPPQKAAVRSKGKPKACKKGFTRKHGKCVKKKSRKAEKAGKRSKRGRK